jgi:hypothetical protein
MAPAKSISFFQTACRFKVQEGCDAATNLTVGPRSGK